MYHILSAFLWLITLLPLPILYIISDFLLYPIINIIGYRREVVRTNLRNSFPEKTTTELRQIEQHFYHHFCDIIIETAYIKRQKIDTLHKQFTFKNAEIMDDIFKTHDGCMLMTSHYGNWEYQANARLSLKDQSIEMHGVYRKLKNKAVDKLMMNFRTKHTSQMVEKNSLLRSMINSKKAGKKVLYGMLSDQSPAKGSIHYWTNFLNQETAMLTGGETLAKKFNFPLVYVREHTIKRGQYIYEIILISKDPQNEEPFAITEKYTRLLEEDIKNNPANWLWSHRRWKHKREH